MADQRVINFIRQSLAKGSSAAQVKKALLNKGWKQQQVDQAFAELNKPAAQSKPESKTKSSGGGILKSKALAVTVGVLLLIIAAVIVVFFVFPSGEDVECSFNSDCGSDEECDNGECVEVDVSEDECSRDSDCGSDEECDNGECVEVVVVEDECSSDSDCLDDEVCDSGSCVVVDECSVDEDCSSDEECVSGICESVADEECGGDCLDNEFCEDDVCILSTCNDGLDNDEDGLYDYYGVCDDVACEDIDCEIDCTGTFYDYDDDCLDLLDDSEAVVTVNVTTTPACVDDSNCSTGEVCIVAEGVCTVSDCNYDQVCDYPDYNETAYQCADCLCGDGICDMSEDATSCVADCDEVATVLGCSSDSGCLTGEFCMETECYSCETMLTDGAGMNFYGDLSNEMVVWINSVDDGLIGSLMVYDVSTKTVSTLVAGTATEPVVSGSVVAWLDNRASGDDLVDVYYYDGVAEVLVTTTPAVRMNLRIDGDVIVWEDGGQDVMKYDISEGVEVKVSSTDAVSPDVYGDSIVWSEDNGGDQLLYKYSLSSGTGDYLSSTMAGIETYPSVYDVVAYIDDSDPLSGGNLYYYDLLTGSNVEVSVNSYYSMLNGDGIGGRIIDVSDSYIVWSEDRVSDDFGLWYDIFAYELATGITYQLVEDATKLDITPRINSDQVVYTERDTDLGVSDVYLTDISCLKDSAVLEEWKECELDADCVDPLTPYCSANECVEELGTCTDDVDCSDPLVPYCSSEGDCVECVIKDTCGVDQECLLDTCVDVADLICQRNADCIVEGLACVGNVCAEDPVMGYIDSISSGYLADVDSSNLNNFLVFDMWEETFVNSELTQAVDSGSGYYTFEDNQFLVVEDVDTLDLNSWLVIDAYFQAGSDIVGESGIVVSKNIDDNECDNFAAFSTFSTYGLRLAGDESDYKFGLLGTDAIDRSQVGSLQSDGITGLSTNEWVRMIGIWDGSEMFLYTVENDGTVIESRGEYLIPPLKESTGDLFVGSNGCQGEGLDIDTMFEGNIQDVRIWGQHRTVCETNADCGIISTCGSDGFCELVLGAPTQEVRISFFQKILDFIIQAPSVVGNFFL